ncbi:hypothetical protein [Anaerococcus degeneri]|uniref:Uncharacterized protein n=1 Tax=Anaerococcus degeneri TaxID=361500 RepID=A0ABS7YWI0_9FIRM|nr:hypothetical protein [Anaerococcus degeneri]MBP2015737.1 hypothetical protein [Anaerococcus degeneri]MCA2096097.1 hypothetical protein [Anaerococcus degeneri]
MGFFSSGQKAIAQSIYEKEVKPNLCEKDGFVHIIMINSFSKWNNQIFCVEDKYTNQVGEIVNSMQADGYEIVDIKFTTLQNQGMFKDGEGFNTLIMYK